MSFKPGAMAKRETLERRRISDEVTARLCNEAIYEALAARDPDQAKQVMREHLDLVVDHNRKGTARQRMNREARRLSAGG